MNLFYYSLIEWLLINMEPTYRKILIIKLQAKKNKINKKKKIKILLFIHIKILFNNLLKRILLKLRKIVTKK